MEIDNTTKNLPPWDRKIYISRQVLKKLGYTGNKTAISIIQSWLNMMN